WPFWSRDVIGDQAVVSFYVGPILLLAALWAAVKGGRWERRALAGLVVCLVLSLGGALPGFAQLTPLHVFRFPANWLMLASAGLGILGGAGIGRLPSPPLRWAATAFVVLDLLLFAQHGRTPWFTTSFLTDPPPLARSLLPDASSLRLYHSPRVLEPIERQT